MTSSAPAINRRTLAMHSAGAACFGVMQAVIVILPFLARQRFHATNWQTTILTAAVPVTQFFTIFWHHIYARCRLRTYFILLAVTACVPIALIALATNVWHVMVLFAVAALGGAGNTAAMSPLNADLLRSCYADGSRGRALGVINASQFAGAMLAGLAIGAMSDRDADSFRVYLPCVAAMMFGALLMYRGICLGDAFRTRSRAIVSAASSLWTPLREMSVILRADKRFAGYEAAFMSYGVGWMICTALVPALATDKLHLSYSDYSRAMIVVYQLMHLALLAPMGWVADRAGPVKLAAASFLWLTGYPLLLMVVSSSTWLLVASVMYAIGMVGVQLTWTLGPVSLAGDPAKAPHYLAIHGTMVGIRGVVFQGLGMALYAWTGRFDIPLVIGAAGFCWAAWRMRRLADEMTAPPIAEEYRDDPE